MLQTKCFILTTNIFINFVTVLSFHIDTNHTIVYEDVMSRPTRATYFGYSVVIHTGREHLIQIGAPRGNSSHDRSVMEPGIVYQCRVGEICVEVNLNGTANENTPRKESKVNAWFGASMTTINGSEGVRGVVCGHRWKDKRHPNNNLMQGSCYVIPIENREIKEQCKLMPLNDTSKYTKPIMIQGRAVRISYTALGQAGISSHYAKKNGDHELIIGAPGVRNWQGATVSYKIPPEKKCRAYSSHIREPDLRFEPVYFGYAVSSGLLFPNKGLVYAVGAPRASEGSGMVLLYEYHVKQIKPIIEIAGTQLGEYFGASIATADINKDGYDDMIIGAPRYSTASVPDQGRIYISLGGEIINKEMKHIEGEIKNAQFGTTVAAIGDINNDGFEDIAVGAPYSNDYRGAVYVYVGGKNGISLAQVINAAQISSSLRGFGISIHHTVETCKRDKTYMAIGAYLSGHVVILRSYPAISLHVQLSSSIKTIAETNVQFSLTVCSWYHAVCGPSKISVTRTILLDPEYYRIHIQDDNDKKKLLEEEVILEESQLSCNSFPVFIHDDKENIGRSIVIEASQMLNNHDGEPNTLLIKTDGTKTGSDTFCSNCSVVNQETSKLYDSLELPFSDCGDDEICNSELHLQCSLLDIVNGSFVIGSSRELKLRFFIVNKKETAYQTILHVQIPEHVTCVSLPRGDCYETTNLTGTILHCNLNSPLDYNSEDELIVEVDMSLLVERDLKSVKFNAWLTTASLNNGSFDSCDFDLKLEATANMRMFGKSAKEVVPFSGGTDVDFEQTYKVYKVGVSSVRKALITINVPYLLWTSGAEKREFLKLIYFEVTQGSFLIQCESDLPLPTSSSNAINPEIQEVVSLEIDPSRSKRDVMKRLKRAEVNKDFSTSSSDNILYLNCTSENVFCQTVTCTSGFTDSKALLNIKLIGRLNTSVLGNIMKTKNIILLSTNGNVDVKEPKNLIPYETERMDFASTTISFVLEIADKKVEAWVIAVSAVCGILLLLLIIIVLLKVGFFKREKKQALKQLKRTTIAEDFYYEKKSDPIPAQQLTKANDSTEETLESKCNE